MMKIQNNFTRILISFSLLLNVLACSKDDDGGSYPINGKKAKDFNTLMASLPAFNQPEELKEPTVLDQTPSERDTEDTSLECYTTSYNAAPGFNKMLALDASTDVIFPGAILKGETIPTGAYVPIIADRTPITLSASLTNIEGSPVVEVIDPKLSSVRAQIKTILDQKVTGATPAKTSFEISEVYSKEQLNLAIGANYRAAATKVSASFDFEQSTYKHKYMFKYFQVYYTIDMDPPQNPSDLFSDAPDLNAIGGTSPVYVSTVTYGRMIIYTVESNYSKTQIDAAFKASFTSSDGSIGAGYEKVIKESSVKAIVIGGSGSDSAQIVNGPQEVYNYISEGGNYSKESPGAPLSYTLRYLKQGTPVARVVLSSEYRVRQCDVAYPLYRIRLQQIECFQGNCLDGDKSNAELYGNISGQMYQNGKVINSATFWRHTTSNIYELGNRSQTIGKTILTEYAKPDYDKDYIRLYGYMKERDVWPDADDDFGASERKVFLRDVQLGAPALKINLNYESKVVAVFYVERVK